MAWKRGQHHAADRKSASGTQQVAGGRPGTCPARCGERPVVRKVPLEKPFAIERAAVAATPPGPAMTTPARRLPCGLRRWAACRRAG